MSRSKAQAVDNGGKEKDEGVSWHVYSVVAESKKINLGVFERLKNACPREFLIIGSVAIFPEPCEDAFSLLWGEELGGCGVIMDEKVGSDGHEDCDQSFLERYVSCHAEKRTGNVYDDEDPSPTAQASHPMHFGKGERLMIGELYRWGRDTSATYEKPAERTGNEGGREKQSDAILLFVSLVPHAEIEHDSREEPALCDAQEKAGDEETVKASSEAHEGTGDTPYKSDGRKPHPRGCEFEDEITRGIEQGVTDKVDAQRGQVLVSGLV